MLIQVDSESAEYWDTPGGRVASVFSFVKAKATGEPYEGARSRARPLGHLVPAGLSRSRETLLLPSPDLAWAARGFSREREKFVTQRDDSGNGWQSSGHEPRRLRALPADLRAQPGPPAAAADRAPRRRAGVGQAGGLQQRAGVRREQDPQARVHRPRRPGLGRGHAGLDRRLPVEPHPSGRRRRRAPRAEVPPRPGALGQLGRAGLHRRRQPAALPRHGRGLPPRPGRVRHRHPGVAGATRCARSRRRGHAVRDPGRRLGTSPGRPRLRRLGVRGRRAGTRARTSSSTRSSSARSRARRTPG